MTGNTRISLREVAERAGVSFSTVSRVLNDVDVKISQETRERVRHAAAEIGYRPNRAARTLVTGRTHTLALCVPTIHSAHTAKVISTALRQFAPHGYDVIVSEARIQANGRVDTSKLLALPVDGIVFSEMPHGVIEGLKGSLLYGKPFVNVGAHIIDNCDIVHIDLSESARDAVLHLHDVGCRRIGYLVPDWLTWFRDHKDERLWGYEAGVRQVGQEPEFVFTPGTSRPLVDSAFKAHIEKHGAPDGLFCYNDEMAIGALRALQDLGLSVPGDVALVGCDGIEDTAYHNPPISTIVMPMAEMFAQAWDFLERRLGQPALPLQKLIVKPHLEVRGSSKR